MPHLSTHVLDTSRGLPAEGILVELRTGTREMLASTVTSADGRVVFSDVVPGNYEFAFHAGEYFRKQQMPLADPPFLDVIIIRFGVSGAQAKVHVPLLLSPYGYSTYRGS